VSPVTVRLRIEGGRASDVDLPVSQTQAKATVGQGELVFARAADLLRRTSPQAPTITVSLASESRFIVRRQRHHRNSLHSNELLISYLAVGI